MQGFGPDYADPPDYILKVTRRIWEDRGIATLRRSYAPDILVRSPASIVQGPVGKLGQRRQGGGDHALVPLHDGGGGAHE
ncbi:MAG: hypothetical protein AAFU61_11445, partial [Pseudomonadota bacterium]